MTGQGILQELVSNDKKVYYTGISQKEFSRICSKLLKDYKPYIEPIHLPGYQEEFYMINGGRYSYMTNKAGAIEADKALRKAAEEYEYKGV